MRLHFALMLRAFETTKPLLDLLHALRKGLHNLVEIAEQLLLIGHSCLELDDAFIHGEIVAAQWNSIPGSLSLHDPPRLTPELMPYVDREAMAMKESRELFVDRYLIGHDLERDVAVDRVQAFLGAFRADG